MAGWQSDRRFYLDINGQKLQMRCWGPAPDGRPVMVLLHEGLGCIEMWKDFPAHLQRVTGGSVMAYERAGYGGSDPTPLPRPLEYMTTEALEVLPAVLTAMGLQKTILIGHSDGASIATILAGMTDKRVRGLCLMAPHFFSENKGLTAIAKARDAYETGTLKARLAKYHQHPDNAFYGWNDAWLHPDFRHWNIEDYLSTIQVPVLALRGEQDAYNTAAQMTALQDALYAPLETVQLQNCGHAPHLEQPDATLALVADFVRRLEQIEEVRVDVHYNAI